MAEDDMTKIAFVTDDGMYYYTRMPFVLKNAWTDFQEAMNKAFEGLIGKIVEIYVNNIIVKSKDKSTVIEDLI